MLRSPSPAGEQKTPTSVTAGRGHQPRDHGGGLGRTPSPSISAFIIARSGPRSRAAGQAIAIGASTYTVYVRGRPRSASFGSTYMIEVRPRISRGRIATRTKLVGSSFDATANTGSRPLSNQAPPGSTLRAGASPTVTSSAPAIKQRTPPPRCRSGSAPPLGPETTLSGPIKYSARGP